MKVNPDFIAPCGLYCGVCAIYIALHDNNVQFKERLASLYKGGVPAGKLRLRHLILVFLEIKHFSFCS